MKTAVFEGVNGVALATEPITSDGRIVAASVMLSIIGCASFLLLPLFLESAAIDLKFTERQIGVISARLSVGVTISNR